MICTSPLSGELTPDGLTNLRKYLGDELDPTRIVIPCRRCVGCKANRAREWAVRIYHEGLMHERKWFITLTYDGESLPRLTPEGHSTVVVDDVQRFLKRLRKKLGRFRYYAVGEYGSKAIATDGSPGHRAHYHLALFGPEIPSLVRRGKRGPHPVFDSPLIRKAWSEAGREMGRVEVEPLSSQRCAYIGGYVTKKLRAKRAEERLLVDRSRWLEQDPSLDGGLPKEIHRNPEFALQSRGGRKTGAGGIGSTFLAKYVDDIYPKDSVTFRKKTFQPPAYYDELAAEIKGYGFMWQVKQDRSERFKEQFTTYQEIQRMRQVELGREHEDRKKHRDIR